MESIRFDNQSVVSIGAIRFQWFQRFLDGVKAAGRSREVILAPRHVSYFGSPPVFKSILEFRGFPKKMVLVAVLSTRRGTGIAQVFRRTSQATSATSSRGIGIDSPGCRCDHDATLMRCIVTPADKPSYRLVLRSCRSHRTMFGYHQQFKGTGFGFLTR